MAEPVDILRSIEHAGECIILTDSDGLITYASPAIEAISGYVPDEVIGRSTRIFKSDRNPPALYADMWTTILDRRSWSGLIENRCKNGDLQLEQIVITPLVNDRGEITQFYCRKTRADDVKPGDQLAYLQRQLPMGVAGRSDFMGRVSYELRTALNSILGFTQILHEDLRNVVDPMQDEYFTIISQSGARIMHMMEDALTLTQLETAEYAFHFEQFAVAPEVRRILANISVLVDAHNLRIIKVIEDNGALVSMDRQCFEQIITNLLVNSIKFTQKGTITIGLETRSGEVVVTVIDTGIGISDAFKPHVFEPFRQEEIGYSQELEGAGLGLAITRRMTEVMAGRISFESTKGEGTTFTVRFPIIGWEKDRKSAAPLPS